MAGVIKILKWCVTGKRTLLADIALHPRGKRKHRYRIGQMERAGIAPGDGPGIAAPAGLSRGRIDPGIRGQTMHKRSVRGFPDKGLVDAVDAAARGRQLAIRGQDAVPDALRSLEALAGSLLARRAEQCLLRAGHNVVNGRSMKPLFQVVGDQNFF